MNVTLIQPESSAYPAALRRVFGTQTLPPLAAIGNGYLLGCRPLAFFCSIKCPGDVILRTYDLIRSIRDAGIPTIGGFHSPMEKECLTLLLRGAQPIIVCPARSIEGMRIPTSWKKPLKAGRLLLLSPFSNKHRRITAEAAATRNLLVAAIAEQIFIAYARPQGKTDRFFQQVRTWGKPIWTVASEEAHYLLASGARPLDPGILAASVSQAL